MEPTRPPGTVLGLRARQWMIVAITLGCVYVVVTAAALTGAWATLNREPTNAELKRAAAAEVARRWQAWPSGRIFPERVSYTTSSAGRSEFAGRLGIVPGTDCAAAVDGELAAVLGRHGCRAVLRATYTDQLEGVVVTVGVVVFPDAFAADRAFKQIPASTPADAVRARGVRPALRAAAFPGTAGARFTDAARQDRTSDRGGPYVVLTTSGQSDGRPASAITKVRPGLPFESAPQIGRQIARSLSQQALPDCSSDEWRC
ncbi:sensor domain-containing protein [Spirillospora sp. NPDC047279]|uniref:sensor domain-containing protein n=1 Tax=Spirillospora sp. NPDC047279 TaxID=3155478 RepID=UPI0034039B68